MSLRCTTTSRLARNLLVKTEEHSKEASDNNLSLIFYGDLTSDGRFLILNGNLCERATVVTLEQEA
jgi:hypothetical protein